MRLILLGLLLALPPVAPPATISGDVRDPTGALLPGATVTLTSPVTPSASVLTDARGRFSFANLPAASYEIGVSLQGFRASRNRLQLGDGQDVATTIQMAIGSLVETVNVVAQRPATAIGAPAGVAGSQLSRPPDRPEPAALGPALPPPTTSAGALVIGGNIREPRKVRDVRPAYPPDARASGIQGTVIMEAIVAADGSVADARTLQGVNGLNDAALEAVRQWRYTPTLLNGEAVPVMMTVSITFRLQ